MHSSRLALIALALTAPVSAAQAQRGDHGREGPARKTGLMLNVHALGSPGFGIAGPDLAGEIETSMGPGLGAQVGWAITPRYMVTVGLDIARLGAGNGLDGHWGFGLVEVGGRVNFPSARSAVTPYVTAAVGRRSIGAKIEDEDGGKVSFTGMSLSVGGGAHYRLSPALALDGNASLAYGKFGDFEAPFQEGDLDVDNTLTALVRVGVNWYP